MSDILAGSPFIHATGIALVAFLWQGAVIGGVAMVLAMLSRRASPDFRYALACAALAALTIAPIVTVARHVDDRQPVAASALAVADPTARASARSIDDTSRLIAQDATQAIGEPLSIVVIVWGIGVCLFGFHLLGSGLQVARLRRSASLLVAPDRLEVLGRLATRLGLTSEVRLFESLLIDVPAVVGWLRPAVVIPLSTLAGLSTSHFEAILAHELAHVRRRDYLVNIVQRVVETLLFYHPAVWWVSSWIRREREHCCDEIAASACGDRVSYARALRALEELRADAPALAMGASGGDLLVRVARLVDRTPVPAPGWPGGVAMIVPFIAFLSVGAVSGGNAAVALSLPTVDARPIETPAPVQTAPAQQAVPRLIPLKAIRRIVAAQPVSEVSGTVTDPSGGVLPGVTVLLKSRASSEAKTAVTAAKGTFEFTDVAAGDYDLDVSLSGFRRNDLPVQVTPGQRLTTDVRMQLGSVAEEMTTVAGDNTSPGVQMPTSLQTAADYLAAAHFYYSREAFTDADAMLTQAIDLIRASQPQVTPPSAAPGVVRVGGSIREPRKTNSVRPIYPAAALSSGAEGVVTLEAIIGRDGTVSDARVTSAASVFDTSAIEAVRQWIFTPTLLNGMPVEVLMTVKMNFQMR
jgi:TonB family protein